MGILTSKQHNELVSMGFKKVKSRCPVCYTEQVCEKNYRKGLKKQIEWLKNQLKFYPETLASDLKMIDLIDKAFPDLKEV